MKKIFGYISSIAVTLAVMTSCDLNLTPTTSIAFKEGAQMITSKTELDEYERGILSSFRSLHYGEFSMTSDICCDGFNATQNYGNNYGGVHRLDDTFKSDDYNVLDHWSANYSAIKNYNVLLEALDNLPEDLKEPSKVVAGEAYFFRAWSYLTLVRLFAKDYNPATAETELAVPVILKYNQLEKPERATTAAVYKTIKDDLDQAATLLASVPGKIRSEKPTIDAVNALYARYYLDIEDYNKAAEYSKKVIDSAAGYSLASTEEEMEAEFTKDEGKEPILQLFSSTQELPATNNVYTLVSAGTDVPLYFSSYYLPSQKLLDLYESGDLRFKKWFSKDLYPTLINGDYKTGLFYTFIRFIGNPALQTGNVPAPRQMMKPITLSEMYLINAEANLTVNPGEAKTALNTLQTKRGASASEATAENIQNEWFKETVGQGLRLSCIKRWNTGYTQRTGQPAAIAAVALMTGKDYNEKSVEPTDYHLVWPIPSAEIQVNKNLTQNPGYGE